MVKSLLILLKTCNRCIKNCRQKSNKKTAEVSGDLVGNFIADKITKKVFQKKQGANQIQMLLAMKYKKKDIYLHKKDKKLLMN